MSMPPIQPHDFATKISLFIENLKTQFGASAIGSFVTQIKEMAKSQINRVKGALANIIPTPSSPAGELIGTSTGTTLKIEYPTRDINVMDDGRYSV